MGEITTPSQLVEEFKKSGEFDKLRRDLLLRFQTTEHKAALLSQVDETARSTIDRLEGLQTKSRDMVFVELARALDGFPFVEGAVDKFDFQESTELTQRLEESLKSLLEANGDPSLFLEDEMHEEDSAEAQEESGLQTPKTNASPVPAPAPQLEPAPEPLLDDPSAPSSVDEGQ